MVEHVEGIFNTTLETRPRETQSIPTRGPNAPRRATRADSAPGPTESDATSPRRPSEDDDLLFPRRSRLDDEIGEKFSTSLRAHVQRRLMIVILRL